MGIDFEEHNLENISYFRKVTLNNIDSSTNDIGTYQKRKDEISKELLMLGEVKKLLIQLKNSKMFEKKDFILNTINTALSDVFNDQNVKIDLIATNTNMEASKLNIKYDIVLYQNGVELSRNEKMVDQNGGGIISFISILFKILVGFIYSRNRFYVFDESLAEVSELYLPRIGQFLQKFCKTHRFNIILITHTPVIAEYADLTYRLDGEFEDGVPTLKIESIEGTYPEEDYIYSKIENFQSIKKLEFRYKGFTTIVGKNNIGKSASFRAINSILFNNFDIKLHPRFESSDKPNKLLNTKIEFGFFSKKDDPENEIKKIGFYKKGQSIIWYFDNMEFVGKNLAFEKVKEKIESIGFKYLKLKEQYKNFKGNLKDQTERLAITTQQDGYYLIAGKAADTSKVFDFLFDSREVTLALIDLNEDIKNLENELNDIVQTSGSLEYSISRMRIELKYWDVLYKITLIKNIKECKTILDFNKNELFFHQKEYMLYDKILGVVDILWRLDYLTSQNNQIKSQLETKANMVGIYDKLINNLQKIDIINNTLFVVRYTNSLNQILNVRLKEENIIKLKEILMINNFVENTKFQFDKVRLKSIILEKLITNMNSIIFLEKLLVLKDTVSEKEKILKWNSDRYSIFEKILLKLISIRDLKNLLNEYENINNYIIKLNKAINYNNLCLVYYDKMVTVENLKLLILNINEESRKIVLKTNQIEALNKTIIELPDAYGLVPCSQCNSLGFTHKGHQC